MKSTSPAVQWAVWGMLILVFIGITAAFLREGMRPPPLPIRGTIPDFSLTNQTGRPITLADLQGQIWVADLIFTRCSGPCIQMTKSLRAVQDQLPAAEPIKLVSLTADPVFDTPDVLRKYADRFGADPARWMFLTGPKQAVFHTAIEGLKLALVEKKPEERDYPEDLFIHSTLFIVVDKQGRWRATVEGAETNAVEQVLAAVGRLRRE